MGNLCYAHTQERNLKKIDVILISTEAKATTSQCLQCSRETPQGEVIEKPDVIFDYNKYMGGVDTSDMMLYAYLDERKTLKFWKKVTFNIISRMVLNAYILNKEHTKPKKPISRMHFTEILVTHLGREWISLKKADNNEQLKEVNMVLENFQV